MGVNSPTRPKCPACGVAMIEDRIGDRGWRCLECALAPGRLARAADRSERYGYGVVPGADGRHQAAVCLCSHEKASHQQIEGTGERLGPCEHCDRCSGYRADEDRL